MTRATSVKFVRTKSKAGRIEHIFQVLDTGSFIKSIVVVQFYNGILTIDPMVKCDITIFAELIGGIFNSRSNFFEEVQQVYPGKEVRGVEFCFNEVPVVIKRDEPNDETAIIRRYNDELYYSVHG